MNAMMGPHIFHWRMMQYRMELGASLFEEEQSKLKTCIGFLSGPRCVDSPPFTSMLEDRAVISVPSVAIWTWEVSWKFQWPSCKQNCWCWVKLIQETSGDIQLLWTLNLLVLSVVWHPRGLPGATCVSMTTFSECIHRMCVYVYIYIHI